MHPPPKRRFAKPISSPRYLTLRHARETLKSQESQNTNQVASSTPLKAGWEQLFSSHIPGLTAGNYLLKAKQDIEKVLGSSDSLVKETEPQEFEVLAPRYTLPPDCIYSVYPPQGQSARPEILPHVVLNDSMLAWERIVSDKTQVPDYQINRVPWLICVAFTADELKLEENEIESIFSKTSIAKKARQTQTYGVDVPISDLKTLAATDSKVTLPISDNAQAVDPSTSLIFLKLDLFNSLFTTYDKNGGPQGQGTLTAQDRQDVSRYRFLAHVRRLNPKGMAYADMSDESADRDFGILVSHRTGPLAKTQPTSVVVHLLSIEGVEKMGYPVKGKDRVGMVSLYSWTYTCLPPTSFSIQDSFAKIAANTALLRAEPPAPKPKEEPTPAQIEVRKRLTDGYSMVKYYLQTGEESVALMKGPLVPTVVEYPMKQLPSESNTGVNLQILDQKLGLLDITYSAAWQLGRTIGMSDQAFAPALGRVRKLISQIAVNGTKVGVLRKHGILYKSKEDLIAGLADSVERLNNISKVESTAATDARSRWHPRENHLADLSFSKLGATQDLKSELDAAALLVASSPVDGSAPKDYPPYNEHNIPYSPDWAVVLRFILDLYDLHKVPAHYLLTSPSHLPAESIRFFYIDRNWVDCLIDGALALANDADDERDLVRLSIKQAIIRYFKTPLSPGGTNLPPVAVYGFLMRSAVVTQYPDLKVDSNEKPDESQTPYLLRHQIWANDIMIGFFSDTPATKHLTSLTFTQPPHQQCFTAAKELLIDKATISYKRIYTRSDPEKDPLRRKALIDIKLSRDAPDPSKGLLFLWGNIEGQDDIRTLNINYMAQNLWEYLNGPLHIDPITKTKWFDTEHPSSSMMGFQLNDPCWQLVVEWPEERKCPEYLGIRCGQPRLRVLEFAPTPKTSYVPQALSTYQQRQRFARREKLRPYPHQTGRLPSLPVKPAPQTPRPSTPKSPTTPTTPFSPWVPIDHPLERLTTGSPQADDDTRITAPQWLCRFSPASDPQATAIPMYPWQQDIIFAITYYRYEDDYLFEELLVSIPMNNPNEPSLAKEYLGQGTTMLSNLRFFVRPYYDDETNSLVMKIIPRSSKAYPVAKIKDLSFMLSGIVVSKFPVDPPDGTQDIKVTFSWKLQHQAVVTYSVPLKLQYYKDDDGDHEDEEVDE
ncbi:hypothetical protein TWF730_009263 [Orbilia blumenaviensis]|uniref:Uncharacterized protein n=1 Tax=Orbilia blumenaviensis TaxID=1796055 RepID=A0AAV9V143_9PEZI